MFRAFQPLTPENRSKRYDGHDGVNFERRLLATRARNCFSPAAVAFSMSLRGLLLQWGPLECVFYDDGIGSQTGLDGRFFGHKMCRIFRNIRNHETGVLNYRVRR